MFPDEMPIWQRTLIVAGLILAVLVIGEVVSDRRKAINSHNRVTSPAQYDAPHVGHGGP